MQILVIIILIILAIIFFPMLSFVVSGLLVSPIVFLTENFFTIVGVIIAIIVIIFLLSLLFSSISNATTKHLETKWKDYIDKFKLKEKGLLSKMPSAYKQFNSTVEENRKRGNSDTIYLGFDDSFMYLLSSFTPKNISLTAHIVELGIENINKNAINIMYDNMILEKISIDDIRHWNYHVIMCYGRSQRLLNVSDYPYELNKYLSEKIPQKSEENVEKLKKQKTKDDFLNR